MGGSADEFPLLSALGLYAAEIRGDGNCLFNALSDQLYGHQNEHHAIRAKVIGYMREHASYYKQFIDVYPGGGMRRNPKRKNAGAYSTPSNLTPPTQEEIDRVFEGHLESMAKGGTYGDNMEITAFSSAFNVDVKIYQRDFAYMVSGGGDEDLHRDTAHIAYHTWEHYSSIRNLDGPHTGLPHVRLKALSPEEEQKQKDKLTQTPYVLPWMIDIVSKSLPFLADKVTIKRTLEECKGNIDSAVSKLLDAEDGGSASSAQESSSVEREPDSDDDAVCGPNKKRDRRLSRATRSMLKNQDGQRRCSALKPVVRGASEEQLALASSPGSHTPDRAQSTQREVSDTEDEDWQPGIIEEEETASASSSPRKVPTRLRINPPKAPDTPSKSGRKTQQKQVGPERRKGPTASQKKDMKKLAQKAARKERAQGDAKGAGSNGGISGGLPVRIKDKTIASGVESGIKTLYI